METNGAIHRLQQLGYLKFVNPSRAAAIVTQLDESLRKGYLDSEWDENLVSADRRTYPADSEEFAEGNFAEVLILMKPILKAEAVSIDSVQDDFREDGYKVTIDGRPHVIWERPELGRANCWALAAKRCLEIVNSLLVEARSHERLWGVYGGNDGRFHLLTDEMRSLLNDPSLHLDRVWMPYSSKDVRLAK